MLKYVDRSRGLCWLLPAPTLDQTLACLLYAKNVEHGQEKEKANFHSNWIHGDVCPGHVTLRRSRKDHTLLICVRTCCPPVQTTETFTSPVLSLLSF